MTSGRESAYYYLRRQLEYKLCFRINARQGNSGNSQNRSKAINCKAVSAHVYIASFHQATGGHYITMLPADWLISTSHDSFALPFLWQKMLWNPSICVCIYIYVCIYKQLCLLHLFQLLHFELSVTARVIESIVGRRYHKQMKSAHDNLSNKTIKRSPQLLPYSRFRPHLLE